jgi:hypothetical protein
MPVQFLRSALTTLKNSPSPKMKRKERENPCFVCGHYHNFEGGEVCGVCGHGPAACVDTPPPSGAFPTEVLPNFLFLGSYDHASRAELLKAMGIKRILNVRLRAARAARTTRLHAPPKGLARLRRLGRRRATRARAYPRRRAHATRCARRRCRTARTCTATRSSTTASAQCLARPDRCRWRSASPSSVRRASARGAACASGARAASAARGGRLHSAATGRAALTRALRAAAEEAYAAGEKVLVHCMSGSSRCARASGARGRARSAHAPHLRACKTLLFCAHTAAAARPRAPLQLRQRGHRLPDQAPPLAPGALPRVAQGAPPRRERATGCVATCTCSAVACAGFRFRACPRARSAHGASALCVRVSLSCCCGRRGAAAGAV